MGITICGSFIWTVVHWFKHSNSLKLPITLFIFFTLKFFSDTSLTITPPTDLMFSSFNLFGVTIDSTILYGRNVDVSMGIGIMCFAYIYELRFLNRNKQQSVCLGCLHSLPACCRVFKNKIRDTLELSTECEKCFT